MPMRNRYRGRPMSRDLTRCTAGVLLALLLTAAASRAAAQNRPPQQPPPPQPPQQQQLAGLMNRLRANWESLEGLSARFTHTFTWVLAGETQVTRGRLLTSGRARFRVEFENRILVSDGTTVWDWDRDQNQVLLFNAGPERGIMNQEQLFLAYTEGVRFEGISEQTRGGTLYVTVRIHRAAHEDPSSVDIEIDTARLLAVRAEYVDGAGNGHTYVLQDIRTGPQDQASFSFTIPEGAVVVDMRPPGG